MTFDKNAIQQKYLKYAELTDAFEDIKKILYKEYMLNLELNGRFYPLPPNEELVKKIDMSIKSLIDLRNSPSF